MSRKKTSRMALEYRGNQLEMLTGGQVTGGAVTPQGGARFTLISNRPPTLRDLHGALGEAAIHRRFKNIEVEVPAEVLQRVALPELITGRVWPRLTAVLGIGEDGEAITLDLTQPASRSLLICAPNEPARQTLLRTAVLSLLMLNRQRDIQLVTTQSCFHREWAKWPHHLGLSLAGVNRLANGEVPSGAGRPHLVVLVDTLELNDSQQVRLRQLLRHEAVSVIALAAATWPGFPALARGGEAPDEFQLTTGGQTSAMQAATLTPPETNLVLNRLRAGRKSRVWTETETRPEKPGCLRRWYNPGRNR